MDKETRSSETPSSSPLVLALAWLVVGVPLLWGVLRTLTKAAALFH